MGACPRSLRTSPSSWMSKTSMTIHPSLNATNMPWKRGMERRGNGETGPQWRKQNTSNANFGRNLHPSTSQRRPRHRSMIQKTKTRVPAQVPDQEGKTAGMRKGNGRGNEQRNWEDTKTFCLGYAKMILSFNLLLSLCTSFHCSALFPTRSPFQIPFPFYSFLSSPLLMCQSLGSIVPATHCKSFVRTGLAFELPLMRRSFTLSEKMHIKIYSVKYDYFRAIFTYFNSIYTTMKCRKAKGTLIRLIKKEV